MCILIDFGHGLVVPFGRLLGHLFGPFFFQASRTLKKGVQKGDQNYSHFLVGFGVCPDGLRKVSVGTEVQFSLLEAEPKRAPKWEPKWSVLGSQRRAILTLGHHL